MSQEVPKADNRIRLPFLDGIRGICALYVVIYHVLGACDPNSIPRWMEFLSKGHLAVTIFIILSGFSLMLPLSLANKDKMSNVGDYVARRARRILPPYYAALILSVILVIFVPASRESYYADAYSHGLSGVFLTSTLAHMVMIHNFNVDWIYFPNGPLWSVATEWDIYFIFPFLLLPIRAKFGNIAAVIVGALFGILSFYKTFELACFWYAGSFAIGMWVSDIAFRGDRKQLSTGLVLGIWTAFWICSWLLTRHADDYGIARKMFIDLSASCGAGAMILYLVYESRKQKSLPISFLTSPAVDTLGMMSYSIYLIHTPFLNIAASILHSYHLTGLHFLVELMLTVPIILLIAYGFHVVCEKPFMRYKHIAKKETPNADTTPLPTSAVNTCVMRSF